MNLIIIIIKKKLLLLHPGFLGLHSFEDLISFLAATASYMPCTFITVPSSHRCQCHSASLYVNEKRLVLTADVATIVITQLTHFKQGSSLQ
jgi:hypothetical protein